MANLLSHLVNGDLALNLTLTAINAALSIFALPAILVVSMTWFLGDGRFLPLQLDKFLAVFGLVLIPTAIGVAIRHRFPELAQRLQKPVRIAAVTAAGSRRTRGDRRRAKRRCTTTLAC